MPWKHAQPDAQRSLELGFYIVIEMDVGLRAILPLRPEMPQQLGAPRREPVAYHLCQGMTALMQVKAGARRASEALP